MNKLLNRFQKHSLLALTLLAAAALIMPAGAIAGPDCDRRTDHPSCGGVVEPGVVYTVELSKGVFRFPATEVSLNSQGDLNSVDTGALVIERPAVAGSLEQQAWDAVTATCGGDMSGIVSYMTINFDNWGVGKNGDEGNLWISLEKIRLPDNLVPVKEVQIQLQKRENPGSQFLPLSGQQITYSLDYYVVWGKALVGKKKKWDTCFQSADGTSVIFPDGELIIKRPGG